LARLAASATVPVAVKLPERIGIPYRTLAAALGEAGIRVVVAHNDFAGLEKLRLEAGAGLELIAVGGIQSGYDVARPLAKGGGAERYFAVGVSRDDPQGFRPVGTAATPEAALQSCLNNAGVYHRRRVKQTEG